MLLKLLRTFSLALENSPKLFKKDFVFLSLSKFTKSVTKLPYFLSASSNNKYCQLTISFN